jgi:TolA-binding protein
MPDPIKPHETYLELQEEENLSVEHLDNQVQKAQEQLMHLKRQQEQIEKQKRELEELSKRQEQLQQGKAEMIEKFTRSLVVLERETYDAQKRVEQLNGIHESFLQHLSVLESINPKGWENLDINRELSKALSAVDDARAEYSKSRPKIHVEAPDEPVQVDPATGEYQYSYGSSGPQDFLYWLKSGFAFTLPLLVIGLGLLIFLVARFPVE